MKKTNSECSEPFALPLGLAFVLNRRLRRAIGECAGEVGIVSGERISSELQQTLQSSHASWAVREWAELGLLPTILPEVEQHWGDRGERACELLDAMFPASWQAKLAALIYASSGADIQAAQTMKERLKLSNADAEAVRFAVFSQPILEQAHNRPWSEVQPLVVHEKYPYALELLDARCKLGLDPHCGDWLRHQVANTEDLDPPPLIAGQDLIRLGLNPGPQFRPLMQKIRQLQLDEQTASSRARPGVVEGARRFRRRGHLSPSRRQNH